LGTVWAIQDVTFFLQEEKITFENEAGTGLCVAELHCASTKVMSSELVVTGASLFVFVNHLLFSLWGRAI
jgi:hypothetical protein